SAGDINGDGYDDIVLGAPWRGGSAYVLYGKATGFADITLASLSAADGFRMLGDYTGSDDMVGSEVASAGDINGDGFDDMFIGAAGRGKGGNAFVVFGKASGFSDFTLATMAPSTGFRIVNTIAEDGRLGYNITGAGDVNGDGLDDLLIGMVGGGDAGLVHVIYGKTTGFSELDVATLAPADGFTISGDTPGEGFGYDVASAGDVNGDGIGDIIVSLTNNGDEAGNPPQAHVIFGKAGGMGNVDLGALAPDDGFTIRGGVDSQFEGDTQASLDFNVS
ncbi:integrin alpha, partial [Methylobrevis pamukkalensis]|uniref:integrin alpha n=1 Tax=Methylobrevis pamukkalensis TaxID=1439726 RepID=UPI001AEC9FE9